MLRRKNRPTGQFAQLIFLYYHIKANIAIFFYQIFRPKTIFAPPLFKILSYAADVEKYFVPLYVQKPLSCRKKV